MTPLEYIIQKAVEANPSTDVLRNKLFIIYLTTHNYEPQQRNLYFQKE